MKKFVVFLVIVVAIVCAIAYMYLNFIANRNTAITENMPYETYLNREIFGSDLASVINRAINDNNKNNLEKDEKGLYIANDTNSIKIQVKITDNDTTYDMETFYNSGMDNFIKYYNQIKFKCTNVEYHETTNKIKYMLFEQITS